MTIRYEVYPPLIYGQSFVLECNELFHSLLHSPGFPVLTAFFWKKILRSSSNKGKLRASRSSQETAMMRGLSFPFLRSMSRKCCGLFTAENIGLITGSSQERCGATHLLIRILLAQRNGCRDGRAAYAVPPECHPGFAIRHRHPKCDHPRIQTDFYHLG